MLNNNNLSLTTSVWDVIKNALQGGPPPGKPGLGWHGFVMFHHIAHLLSHLWQFSICPARTVTPQIKVNPTKVRQEMGYHDFKKRFTVTLVRFRVILNSNVRTQVFFTPTIQGGQSCWIAGLVDFDMRCSTIMSNWSAISSNLPSAQALLGRMWNSQIKSHHNRPDGSPCSLESMRPPASFYARGLLLPSILRPSWCRERWTWMRCGKSWTSPAP